MKAINAIFDIAEEKLEIRPRTLLATACVATPAAITLIALAKLAILGLISATTLGACSIGLGAGIYLLTLPSFRGNRLVRQLIIGGLATAALVTVGALGIAGIHFE